MPNYTHRNLEKWALTDPLFPAHMSFILGPRQVGKTSLARAYLEKKSQENTHYFNWDDLRIQKKIRIDPYFFESLQITRKRTPLVFDEIHKMRKWKQYLKGAYDQFKDHFFFIITGSGRLDFFQRGGDSLAGRYDPYFLFPLTPGELERRLPTQLLDARHLLDAHPLPESSIAQWEALGGFPEPFFSSSSKKALAWWDQYKIRVSEQDMRDLTQLQSVDLMRNLLELLPDRVGSPLSLNSLREDLACSHATVERYVRSLNQLFFTFDIAPFSKKIHRAIRKEKKIYFFNHAALSSDLRQGARFENMVALLLSKWCSSANERALGRYSLCYLRDQDRREVDFLISLDDRPALLIEAKVSDLQFTGAGTYYSEKLGIPLWQIVRQPKIGITRGKNLVASIHSLAALCG